MKKLVTMASAVLFIINSFTASAQQTQQDSMMKAWSAYMTPGDVHKMIAKWDGKWKEDLTFWMQPGAPPTKSTATCVNKMIMGGRYQQSTHSGVMMGQPFEGQGTLAWDNARKMFISTWIDNMGTGIMYMEGPWDNATKTATLKGKTTDPMTGKEMDVRQTFNVVNDNTQKLEMFMTQDGKEFKTMEIIFTRAK
ncbi:DUF1579 domain-containing protein [Niastella caeni]|uniref:DUF1579 domain-containing protein n=1 Tax=Niastella caeni TaxID=2569763 RepID=A0A4S8I1Y1_9BACT|nr:DUF1579 domain-containing protein [Niastella caeni]THU41975.1 DUF1579 domain-containing protein [Niastella caeni]